MRLRLLFTAAALLALSAFAFGQPAYINFNYYFCPSLGGSDPPMTRYHCWWGTPIPDGGCYGTICVYDYYTRDLLGCYDQGFNSGEFGCEPGFFAADYPITWYAGRWIYCEIRVDQDPNQTTYSTYDHPYYTVVGDNCIETTESWWTCTIIHCCPEDQYDLGDLGMPYPTSSCPGQGPGHWLSYIAWLGEGLTHEAMPHVPDSDPADDGVVFNGPFPWTACTMVSLTVTVTAGSNYQGQPLFLSGWKDGNYDGDFDDELCQGAPEWIIQDAPVVIGPNLFTFMNPGVSGPMEIPGIFRFRLSSMQRGAQWWMGGCDPLGEIEDYFSDLWIPVELTAFEAVPGDRVVTLNWSTASERDNSKFEIERRVSESGDWVKIGEVPGAGSSSTQHDYTFVDGNVVNGITYCYRLTTVDLNGKREVKELTVSATPTVAGVSGHALHPCYPNPFNAITEIRYDLYEAGYVHLEIFDLLGRRVTSLVNAEQPAGHYAVRFDASHLPTGVYLYCLEINDFTGIRKMLLLK